MHCREGTTSIASVITVKDTENDLRYKMLTKYVKRLQSLIPYHFNFCLIAAPHKYYIGFRYVHPLTEDAVDEMTRLVILCD